MSKNLDEIPFSELVERTAQIARIGLDSNEASRVRGAVNDIYLREIPAKEDWTFLMARSSITCTDDFKTGTVSVNTQDTAVTFSTDVTLDATFTGRQIKFNGNANVYDFTFSNATGGTITPALSGTKNITSGAYNIFAPFYTLASNFDRFPKNGGLLVYQGGQITPVPEVGPQQWYREYSPNPGIPERCRLVQRGSDLLQVVETNVPPGEPFVLSYEYFIELDPLRETTSGFVDIDAGSTGVVGSAGTTLFTEAQTGWYFRIDAFGTGDDSEWYRVSAITHDSSLTLASAFGLSGATTASYTLSPVPRIPAKMQHGILYGAVRQLMTDQNDPLYQVYESKFNQVITEGKNIYKSRQYNQFIDTVLEDVNYRR